MFFEKDYFGAEMMDSFMRMKTGAHVTRNPRRTVDDSVPLCTWVPQDCLEAVWPSSAELSLKHRSHFLNPLLKTASSSGLCKLQALPLAYNPPGAQRLWLLHSVHGSSMSSARLSPQPWPPPWSWRLLHVCQREYQCLLAGEEVAYQARDFWNMILGFLFISLVELLNFHLSRFT